jgi:hypothetical protein
MAKFVLRQATITVNGTDLSDHCSSITLENAAEEVDFTSFGASNYREFSPGMKDATITAEFYNDFAAASVDSVLNACFSSSTAFPVVVKADSGAVSSTNPSFTMSSKLYTYSPLSGGVGEANTTSATFRHSGTAGLVRGTS